MPLATLEEIREILIHRHSPSRAELSSMGVSYPPPSGWKRKLMHMLNLNENDLFRLRREKGIPKWGIKKTSSGKPRQPRKERKPRVNAARMEAMTAELVELKSLMKQMIEQNERK